MQVTAWTMYRNEERDGGTSIIRLCGGQWTDGVKGTSEDETVRKLRSRANASIHF